jgi:hypothetical protein
VEDASHLTWQALPADRRAVYEAVVRFLLQWLAQDEVELATMYVAQLRRLQRSGQTWPACAAHQHQEN